jgi:hypothetical protein
LARFGWRKQKYLADCQANKKAASKGMWVRGREDHFYFREFAGEALMFPSTVSLSISAAGDTDDYLSLRWAKVKSSLLYYHFEEEWLHQSKLQQFCIQFPDGILSGSALNIQLTFSLVFGLKNKILLTILTNAHCFRHNNLLGRVSITKLFTRKMK